MVHALSAQGRYRLGVDIGGTFTDLSLIDDETQSITTHKVQSTPESPSRAVSRGIVEVMRRVGASPSDIGSFVHGTTIALNAVLERRGSQIALFVSEGTRDILELGRQRKSDLFNLRAVAPVPLVPRRRVFEIAGRIAADGQSMTPLDEEEVKRAVCALPPEVESVALCFMNAYLDERQERQAAAAVAKARPGLHVSCSTQLWPEIREYERATVAALNAYVQPIMRRYVDELERETAAIGLATHLYITRSNGGVMSASGAREQPVHTMLSGPASGVVGAAYIATRAGVTEAVTLDIGGTSADVAVIRDGAPVQSTEAVVGDFPIIMPAVDVFAVGAGGGSIAWFDEAGLLKLGPRSAGASPGPACYGQGGTEPTTTDAYLTCGFLDPHCFADGAISLQTALADAALGAVAERLGVTLEQAAESVLTLATATMAGAILPMLTKRGIDPRDFTLIAFGGAGPTHACLLAQEIGIPRVMVPPAPGALCAYGAAMADIRSERIRIHRVAAEAADPQFLRSVFIDLEAQARDWLAGERPDLATIEIRRSASLRYRGQAFDVEVEIPEATPTAALDGLTLAKLFHRAYETLYSNSDTAASVDIVDLRVAIAGRTHRPEPRILEEAARGDVPPRAGSRSIVHGGQRHAAGVYDRAALKAGHVVHGPAVIEQPDTTTVVLPGYLACADRFGNLMLSREAA